NDFQQLIAYYHYADLTLLLSEKETFSMVVAESLCAGTEVVGYKAGGPESIALLDYSEFVEHGDVDALCEAIARRLEKGISKDLVAKMAKDKYANEKSKNEYLTLFENMDNQVPRKPVASPLKSLNNFFKNQKESVLLAASLFAYFLLTILPSTNPLLFESGISGWIYRIVSFAVFIIVNLILVIRYKSRIPLILGGLVGLYILFGIGLSLFTPSSQLLVIAHQGTLLTFASSERLNNMARTLGVAAMVISFVSVLPEVFKQRSSIRFFMVLIAFFALVSSLYASAFQFDTIINSFTAPGEDAHFYQVTSFFTSKNIYGLILFCGLLALAYYCFGAQRKTRIAAIVAMVWLFIHLIISRNKTALLLVLVGSAALLIYLLVKTFKTHKKRNSIIVIAIGVVTLFGILFLTIPALHPADTILDTLHHYVYQNFILIGIRTIGTRFIDLSRSFSLLSSWQITIGYGEQFAYSYYNLHTGMISIDNALVATLLTGGILKLFLLIYLYYLSFKKTACLFRYNRNLAFLLLIIQLSIILQGLTESLYLLRTDAFAIVFYSFAFLIPHAEISSSVEERDSHLATRRVLHVVASFGKGGTESFILGYANLLKNEGIIVDLFCYGKVDDEQRQKIEALGGAIYEGVAPSKKNYLKAYKSFSSFLDKYDDYLAIHANCNFDNALFLSVARNHQQAKRVFHAHDTLTGIRFSLLERAIIVFKRFTSRLNATSFIACSKEAGSDILGARFFARHGLVIQNLVAADNFIVRNEQAIRDLKDKYHIPEDAFVIGNITRFEPKKNQSFIIDLFKQIHEANHKAILVLGGPDGGQEKDIRQKTIAYGLAESVHFIGPQSDVASWLHIFDLYLFPSLFEGFGI
ncbi:MAG: glycosyltransferase, partial [Bacilli bacterium]